MAIRKEPSQPAVRPFVKVYGERNTGTNYLMELIGQNFQNGLLPGVPPRPIMRLQKRLPGKDLVRDVYFMLTFSSCLGWKHALVPPPHTLRRLGRVRSVVFVTITKNPYSWILSLYNRPYHRPGQARSLEEFVTQPWPTVRRENSRREFANPVELWNQKNAAYLRLADGFPTVNLRYEDLVASPEAIVAQLASKFALVRRGEFRNVLRSTKGEAKDFEAYRQYYLEERWKEKLSPGVIEAINRRLDREVADHFGYEVLSGSAAGRSA